jgi:pyruvate/2-oxoglutarate dehydrogenase complex dihydrolipoamide acyltransferase (E2) component
VATTKQSDAGNLRRQAQIDDDDRQEAQNAGLDVTTVKGTGPDGRVTLADVQKSVKDQQQGAGQRSSS